MPYACDEFNPINFGGVMPDHTTRLSQNGEPISNFFGQSSFATYAVVHESNVVKVPYDDIDIALVGPLGCGIQTGAGTVLNYLKPKFGSSIAVFGCGTVGMSAIMAAKIANCAKIIAVGGNPKSLELAKELGATHTINRKESAMLLFTDRRAVNSNNARTFRGKSRKSPAAGQTTRWKPPARKTSSWRDCAV